MKTIKTILTLMALLLPFGAWAATVTIPTAAGKYISWNDCVLTGANVENNGENIGSTGKSTVAVFTIQNDTQQDYILTFATGTKNAAKMKVTFTNNSSSAEVVAKDVDIPNTGSWDPGTITNIFIEQLPVGTYELKFQVTEATSYAGNWGKLAFYTTDSFNRIPGTISITSGGYAGGARLENNNDNVGWISNGTSASYSFICSEAGVYKMTIPMSKYGDGTITTTVVDEATGNVEADGTWTMTSPANYEPTDVPVEGELTTGMKTMTMQFATTSSFLFNYKNFTMTRVGDHFAAIRGVSIAGQTITKGDDSDWYCQLPAAYDATTTFSANVQSGTVNATATDAKGEAVSVTDNGDGTFTLPTPAGGSNTVVTLTLTPAEGAASSKTTYTLKLFRIGEISLTAVNVDGISIDVLDEMNNNQTATCTNVFTSIPTVSVKVVDGSTVVAPAPTVDGTKATYSIHVEMAGKTKDYTLVVDGLHIYNKVDADETVTLKYSGEDNDKTTKVWTNGIYSLSPVGDGWGGSGFKLSANDNPFTLTVPTDVKVKQFILHEFKDNYAPGSFKEISSDGMTAYVPMKHSFDNVNSYDLIINLEGHQAGKPIQFSFTGGSQITGWYELTIEKQAITTAPVVTDQKVTVVKNHAVVALTFDREMTAVTATINGGNVTAEGGSATLYFPVWDLNYSSNYTLTIAAGAAKDNYGNANAEAINIAVNTAAKPVVEQAAYDYVVGTAAEFSAAIAAVNSSNASATAARKVIFVKNGDYDFGSTEQNLKAYNVSIVGESRDGVVLHGNRSGITNPILQVNSTGGDYFQDFTIRNDLDWQKERAGVGVAFSGGKKAVLKNIAMQSQQDTQVTGESAYYLNCRIYGAVDFICGGGNHFYDQCDLLITNGGHITAPNTAATTKWGYVFQHCTVDTAEGANQGDGSYNLGRPWQNEPRAYFLNTTMNIKSTNDGWGKMSTLVTHFYEYNSVDKNGQAIDLSIRKNSPTSTNSYSPILTDEEAKKFTVENVLGGTDSWLPTEECVEMAAPAVSVDGKKLSWAAVEDARCYVIFKDGAYVANQTATTYEAAEDGQYTVRAANLNGGMGAASEAVAVDGTTGIREIDNSTLTMDNNIYNLNGQRVSNSHKGLVIMNGKVVVIK